MKVGYMIALFCISLIGLSGCVSKSYPKALRQAERCMEANPDSARLYLSTLDSVISTEPEETRMYYYLLKTKVADKLYVKHTSDSFMLQVVRFYAQKGDADKLMEAYYYLGSVYRDMNDAPRALKAFQRAAEAGKNSLNYRVLGRLYEQIGTLFAYQELYAESLQSVNKALKYYQLCDYAEAIVYNYRNRARIYDRTHRPDSAEYFYRKSSQAARKLEHSFLEDQIVSEWVSYYISHNEIEKAENLIPSLSWKMRQDDAITLHALGVIARHHQQTDSARYYFLQALQRGNLYVRCGTYQALADLEAGCGNYRLAFEYARHNRALGDSIQEITRTDAVDRIHSLYNYEHVEKANRQLQLEGERKQAQIYRLLLVLLVLAGGIIGGLLRYRKQQQAARDREAYLQRLREEQERNSLLQMEQNRERIQALEVQLAESELLNTEQKQQLSSERDRLEQHLLRLRQQKEEQERDSLSQIEQNRERIQALEAQLAEAEQLNAKQEQLLLSERNLLEISNRKIQINLEEKNLLELNLCKSEVYQYFHIEGYWGHVDPAKWGELQQEIETAYPRFITRLRFLYPQISEQELRLCHLTKIAIPVKGIAVILCKSMSAITNMRTRLYKKLLNEAGKASDFDRFIHEL